MEPNCRWLKTIAACATATLPIGSGLSCHSDGSPLAPDFAWSGCIPDPEIVGREGMESAFPPVPPFPFRFPSAAMGASNRSAMPSRKDRTTLPQGVPAVQGFFTGNRVIANDRHLDGPAGGSTMEAEVR